MVLKVSIHPTEDSQTHTHTHTHIIYIYTQARTIEATECSKHLPTLSFCSPKHFPRNYDLTSKSLMELCICMIVAQDGIFTLQFQGGSNE